MGRKYLKSHPWITFKLNIPLDRHMFWLKMGEIASKCEHLAGVPLRPDIASRLHTVFLAKGVLATTAIEGNTLNEEQVIQQIDGTLDLPPSQRYLQQEIQNILDACNAEVRGQINDPNWAKHICSSKIKEYNSQVLKGLDVENDVVPGEFRSHSVVVGNVYRGAPAEDCEYLVDRLCEWLNGSDFECQDNDLTIPTALIRAIVAHVYLAWIHPFGDGNGRTARLVELQVLFSCGIPLPAAHLLSDHYNKTRTQYYRELNHASKSGGDVIPFITYALQGFLDGLREQLSLIRTQQQNVAWENYVHDKFRQYKPSPTQKRRRDLVLELTKHNWKQVSDIPDMSPTLAREYANAGERMLQRDLNAINKMDLILRRHGEVRARKELISAFLPATTPTPI